MQEVRAKVTIVRAKIQQVRAKSIFIQKTPIAALKKASNGDSPINQMLIYLLCLNLNA